MFNFDCKVSTKKHTFEIVSLEILVDSNKDSQHDFTTHEANALVEVFYNTIKAKTNRAASYLNGLDLINLINELKYLTKARDLLIEIKKDACGFGYSKTHEDFSSEVNRFFSEILSKVENKKYSYPEQMVIGYFGGAFENELESWGTDEYYDVKKDKIKIEKEHEQVLAYDFTQFGLTNKEMIQKFDLIYKSLTREIKAFKAIIKLAGNEIVNWSNQKITRRARKNKIDIYGRDSWISDYKEHLKKQGIKPDEKKMSATEKAKANLEKKNVSQEDLVRVFKQGSYGTLNDAIVKMSVETIQGLLISTLNCVVEKLNASTLTTLIARYCNVATTKVDYKQLSSFCNTHKAWPYVSWEYMIKSMDYVTIEDTLNFGNQIRSYEGNEQFFTKVLTKVSEDKRFSMNPSISYEYLKRMTQAELINIIPKFTKENCTLENVVKLYSNIPYDKIRQSMLGNKDFLLASTDLIVAAKDLETSENCLMRKKTGCYGNGFDCDEKTKLFNILSYEKKLELVLKDMKKSGLKAKTEKSYYNYNSRDDAFTYNLEHIFSISELLKVLKEVLNYSNHESEYIDKICEIYKDKKCSTKNFNQVLLDTKIENLCNFPIDDNSVVLLSNDVKIRILESGKEFSGPNSSRGHYYGNTEVNIDFFKTLSRQEVEKALGRDLLHNSGVFYLGSILNQEELVTLAERDNAFLRFNIEHLSYAYLKKFKGKAEFKKCVGDCRDRSNKAFAEQLIKKLDIPNSVDFILSLSEENA